MSNNVSIEAKDLKPTRDERIAKERKPYKITKQRERWTEGEHKKFIEAIKLHGRDWRRIKDHIGTKTAIQIRSHAQKFFSKLEQDSGLLQDIKVPPPRPKRKATHPYPRSFSNAFSKEFKSPPNFFSRYINPLGRPYKCMATHQKLLQDDASHVEGGTSSSLSSSSSSSLSSLLSSSSPSSSLSLSLSSLSSLSLSEATRSCLLCHPLHAHADANANENVYAHENSNVHANANNGVPHERSFTCPTPESLISSPNSGFKPWHPQKKSKSESDLHASNYPAMTNLQPHWPNLYMLAPYPPLIPLSTPPWPISYAICPQRAPHTTTPHQFSVLEGSAGEIIIRNDGEDDNIPPSFSNDVLRLQ